MSQPGNSQASSDKRISQVVFADSMQTGQTMNLTAILSRQRWVILFAVALGLAVATFYWTKATIWYESTAEVLVSQRDQGISATGEANPNGEVTVEDDVLANHMVVLRSRRIIEGALKRCELSELPSILQQLKDPDDDAADYVINHLKLSRGGTGAAKDARSLKISFEHIDPEDTRTILEAIVIEYQMFLSEQMSKSTMDASSLIEESRLKLEKDLEVVQNDYIEARQKAPVLFQGDGSSNVYLEQFRRLHEELLTLDIQESGTKSRYEKALLVLSEKPSENDISIDDLGIIDSDSLKRLGVFAELQANSARSVDFQAAQPERLEEARTNYSHMLQLMSEKRRLESDFGPSHPDVRKLDDEIKLVKSFVEERARDLPSGWNDVALTPAGLLKAYIAFLKSELTSISERRNELAILKQDAETQARMLVEFELKEGVLKSRVDRTQELFDRLVEKLRDLDMATGLKGYVHELLESPRMGIQVWPSLPICGVAGLLLGLVGGLFLAVVNDQLDNRFRSSSEIDESIGVPILGRVGRIKTGDKSPIVLDNSPESESFRVLRTLLLGDVREGRLRVMTATSPLPGDGKTTILCNVAGCWRMSDAETVGWWKRIENILTPSSPSSQRVLTMGCHPHRQSFIR